MKFTFIGLIFLIAVPNFNCSKDDDGGDDFVIPIIDAAQWSNKADDRNTFFFFNVTPDTNTSTFDGNENPIGGGSQYHFTGSFTNHNIQFIYDDDSGDKSGKTFSGTINDASTEMTLNNSDLGELTLEKQ